MRIGLILTILLMTLGSALGGEAFFRPESRKHINLKEGDSFKGIVELWNIENISPVMISQLQAKTFIDHFYVVSLDKPIWSENNPQVVLIRGTFILQKKIDDPVKTWKLGGLEIPVTIKEINSEVLSNKNKKFIVLDGKYELGVQKDNKIWYLISLLIVILLAVFLIRKKNKKEIKKEVVDVDWRKKLSVAKKREDFSHIYLAKNQWLGTVKNKEIVAADFLKCSENYLFKEKLEDFELEELRISAEAVVKGME